MVILTGKNIFTFRIIKYPSIQRVFNLSDDEFEKRKVGVDPKSDKFRINELSLHLLGTEVNKKVIVGTMK